MGGGGCGGIWKQKQHKKRTKDDGLAGPQCDHQDDDNLRIGNLTNVGAGIWVGMQEQQCCAVPLSPTAPELWKSRFMTLTIKQLAVA